jgi:hypothetical protein
LSTDRPKDPKKSAGGDHRSPAEIRRHIQETRADLDATVDELSERLRPQRIAWEARRKIEPKVRQMATQARYKGYQARDRARQEAEDHKLLFVAVGAGLVGLWLLAKMLRDHDDDAPFPEEQQGV